MSKGVDTARGELRFKAPPDYGELRIWVAARDSFGQEMLNLTAVSADDLVMTDLELANSERPQEFYATRSSGTGAIAFCCPVHQTQFLLNPCPLNPEDIAEAYLMGHLRECELIPYEQHFISCAACTEQLKSARKFIESVRAAAISLGEH